MAINSLSAASKGFSGLASGIDTESVVKSMLSGTQSKIDSQNQKKTQLEYKQEMYRSIISDLQTFQTTYFSYTNQAANLLSQSFFESKNASTTSSNYTVSATSGAAAGNMTVDSITSLASNFKQTANNSASAVISGTLNTEKLQALSQTLTDELITFKIGTKTIDVSVGELAGKSSLEAKNILNAALKEGDTALATVEYVNGSFTLTTSDENSSFSITGSSKALELVGGTNISGTGSASFKLDTSAVLPTLSVTIDGVAKSVTFNPMSETGIAEQLNSAIASAFGGGITVSEAGGEISLTASNSSRKISITGDDDTMAALGLKNRVSNKISLNNSLNNNYFATPVVGQRQEFTINGVDFSFSSDQTISSIMNAINNSDAGVKISYSSTTDTFSLAATSSGSRGDGYSFDISQSEGNLMTALFGVSPSGNTTGAALNKELTSASIPEGDFLFKSGTVNLNVNGSKVTLTIPNNYTSADSLVKAVNEALVEQFGKDSADNPNVSFAISEDGKTINLNTAEGYTAHVYDDSLSALGFNTKVTGTSTLAELGIKDNVVFNIGENTLSFDVSTSINDMISQINTAAKAVKQSQQIDPLPADWSIASFDESNAYIRICGVDIPMNFIDTSGKLFEQTEGNLSNQTDIVGPLFTTTDGSNAVVTVNGVEIERSTNSFTVDGISLTLLSETQEASTVTVTQDTDKIYETVTKFIDDYNTLINSFNKLLDADPTYKKYPPLTVAQEDEMTESQVEKWETKAKEGLLRNDSALSGVLSAMRKTLYTKPEGSLAFYDLGITTSYFGTKDNLVISDPSKLKSLISENPGEVMKLFTDAETGLSTLMNNAINDAARTSTVNPGSLVRIAGSAGRTDTSSNIHKQINDIKSSLNRLEDKYQKEYKRYWAKFNSMESLISNMNSTSSWLTSMMSSSQ
ncbi:flagellar filament capping protein FliD [Oscillospiraceae bacterium LTW-04]|nr:flagellar filament capping protein FliD [Oscillospiraceae bacterium MB24-C1]